MGMLLGATVYVFSIILAVFLIGLAIGSAVGSMLLRAVRPRLALGWCQILLTLGIAWTAYIDRRLAARTGPSTRLLTHESLAHVPARSGALPVGHPAADDLCGARAFRWRCAGRRRAGGEDSGRVVGGVYAANTLGAIVGALGVSLVADSRGSARSNRSACCWCYRPSAR